MPNADVIKQVTRIQSALPERAGAWAPTLAALQAAEEAAAKEFLAAPVLRKPYAGNDNNDKEDAAERAWGNTTVLGQPAWLFRGTLTLGVGPGMAYFGAIDSHLHGRRPTTSEADRNDQMAGRPVHGTLSSFDDLPNRVAKDLHWLNIDLGRLTERLRSETAELPADHAANAVAAMLFSPLLYPPEKAPDVDALALGMEWTLWVALLPYVTEQLATDKSRQNARQVTIVDINAMMDRLSHIVKKGAPGVAIPAAMKDLAKFRRDLLEGKFTKADAVKLGVPTFRIEVAARLPEAVVQYLNGSDEHRRMMVRNARLYLRLTDAKIKG